MSFCVEAGTGDQVFYLGAPYTVFSVTPEYAVNTGNLITNAAKWVYYQAVNNTHALAGYTGDVISNSEVQEAIWLGVLHPNSKGAIYYAGQYYEGLGEPADAVATAWYNQAVAATTDTSWSGYAQAMAEASTIGILNPYNCAGHAQSQLFQVYQNPEPASLLVWSGLAAGCWFVGLRRRKQKAVAA
jgi:hypothetical protein